MRHQGGPDNGDLPNLCVTRDGTSRAKFYRTRIALQEEGKMTTLRSSHRAIRWHLRTLLSQ